MIKFINANLQLYVEVPDHPKWGTLKAHAVFVRVDHKLGKCKVDVHGGEPMVLSIEVPGYSRWTNPLPKKDLQAIQNIIVAYVEEHWKPEMITDTFDFPPWELA